MIDKEKYIQFLQYLRDKDEVHVDELVVKTGLLDRQTVDRTPEVRSIVKGVCKAATIEAAYTKAYTSLMHYARQSNPCWKEQPNLLFFEDVYEFFLAAGYDESKANEYTCTIASGNFLSAWQIDHAYRALFHDDENLCRWAKSTKWLPHRSMLAKLLPTEYDLFLREYCNETFDVEERPGAHGNMLSASRYLYNRLQYDSDAAFNFPSNQLTIPCGILLLPTSFTDVARLYRVAHEWFPFLRADGVARYRGNVLSIGRFAGYQKTDEGIQLETKDHKGFTIHPEASSNARFDSNCLCVCTTALQGDALKHYCRHIMLDLGIPYAYLKDGFNYSFYYLSINE